MLKKTKNIFSAIAAFIFLCSMSVEKTGDTYWFVNGDRYYWFFQPDVFAFRCRDEIAFEKMNSDCVAFQFHREQNRDKLNVIYFKNGCDAAAIEEVKKQIREHHSFESEFPVITLFPQLDFNSAAWYVLDDLLLVNFNHDSLTDQNFHAFTKKYSLRQINFPDSATAGNFTYIFQFDPAIGKRDPIELSQKIYQAEAGLVSNVQPNLINAFREISGEPVLTSSENFLPKKDIEYHLVHKQNESIRLFVKIFDRKTNPHVKVYDLFGRYTYGAVLENGISELEIKISDYAFGLYFVCIEDERGEVLGTQRFMKW